MADAAVAQCINCGWKADAGISHEEYVTASPMTAWLCARQDGTIVPPRPPAADPVLDDNGTVIGYATGS